MRKIGSYGAACVIALGMLGPVTADDRSDFDALLTKVQTDGATMSDQEVIKMLQLSRKLGESFDATLAIKSYLRQQPSAEVMLEVARTTAESGDLNLAVARYKRYLSAAKGDKAGSDAAAELYNILIDELRSNDDAYLLMQSTVVKFRGSPAARRYDSWFMDQALRRKDYKSLGQMLSAALSSDGNSELTKTYYWPSLATMMDRLAGLGADNAEVLPVAKKLMQAYQGPAPLKARYQLNLAAFEYRVKAKTLDEKAREKSYGVVLDAAKAYLKADPTSRSLRHTMLVFSGGNGLYRNDLAKGQVAKAKVLVEGYKQLPAKEQYQFKVWGYSQNFGRLIDPYAWAAAGASDHMFYSAAKWYDWRNTGATKQSINQLKAQAKTLEGLNTPYAAVVRTLIAANGKDFNKAAEHMFKNESWALRPGDAYGLLDSVVFPYIANARGKGGKADWTGRNEAWIAYGKMVAQTPGAVTEDRLWRRYIETLGSDFDNMAKNLKVIQWLPTPSKKSELANALKNAERWLKGQRKREGAATKIAAITEVLNKMGQGKAPNAATQQAVNMTNAVRNKDAAGFKTALTALNTELKGYAGKKTPYAHAAYVNMLRDRGRGYVPAQAEVLKSLYSGYSGKGDPQLLMDLTNQMTQATRYRQYFRASKNETGAMKLIHGAVAVGMAKAVANNEIPIGLFYRWRATRRGDRWGLDNVGNDIMVQIIDKKLFEKTGWRMSSGHVLAVPSYQLIIHNEFPQLRASHNPESWFDQRFIEEATAAGYWDRQYWERGRDPKRVITKAAVGVFSAQQKVPLRVAGNGPYTRDDLNNWYWRIRSYDSKAALQMSDQLSTYFGKTRFDVAATGRNRLMDIETDLGKAGPRAEWFKSIEEYTNRLQNLPVRSSAFDMRAIKSLRGELSAQEARIVENLLSVVRPSYDARNTYPKLSQMLAAYLIKNKEWSRLSKVVPTIWVVARESRNTELQDYLAQQSGILQRDDHEDLAIQIAVLGLDLLKSELSESSRSVLSAARGKAMANVQGVIPVPQGDPRYPLYAAQNAYLTGKEEGAWKFYAGNEAILETTYSELDPSFVIWLIERHTGAGVQGRAFAQKIADLLTDAADQAAATMDAETRARIYMAPASIALAETQNSRARALYQRITENPDFAGTEARIDALLAMVDIDRQDKNFDSAEKILEMLSKRADRRTRALVAYAQAKIKFDQEEYPKALEYVDMSLALYPANADASLLRTAINLKRDRLVEVIESTPPGSINETLKVIVPGKPLVIRLEDKNLTVIGSSTSVEIRAWTDSGDEEIFNLTPLGDKRDTFKGERRTALGAPSKGDGIIQLRGGDKLHYSYSDRFVKRNNITNQSVLSLDVKSNAEMYASSGAILTKEDRERKAEEERIIRAEGLQVNRQRDAVALSTKRPDSQVKPGNPINIRVIDTDRSTTEEQDTITVSVSVPSGDAVAALELKETEPFSGIFEGVLKTSSGQPKAYATDSQDGSEPNYVISPGEHEPWVALPNSVKPKMFSVDLNDNVALGKLTIDGNVEGRKLKDFLIQTSLNGRDFETVGRWPKPYRPWTGESRIEIAPMTPGFRAASDNAYAQYMEHGYLSLASEKFTKNLTGSKVKFDLQNDSNRVREQLKVNYDSPIIVRYRFAFYQDEAATRTFQLKRISKNTRTSTKNVAYVLQLNGTGAPRSRDAVPNLIQRRLNQGMHTLDIYVVATGRQINDADLGLELLVDTDTAPYQEVAPLSMFGGAKVKQELSQAQVKINSTGAGQFDVTFPDEMNARVVRLVMQDYESDAPGLNKLRLVNRDGTQLLPTKQSFEDLRKNDILEIVPGDRVTILYKDPTYLSEAKDQLEAYLTATYTNANISAAFVTYTESRGEMRPNFVAMRRFKVGDTLNVFISDPDMDVSGGQDTVKYQVRTNQGKNVTLEAIETEAHSGVFLGKVFPIEGTPQRPEDIQTARGNRIILTYRDQDNLDPGIAWDRTAEVEQVQWEQPLVRVFNVNSQDIVSQTAQVQEVDPAALGRFEEFFPKYKDLVMLVSEDSQEQNAKIVLGGPMVIEVLNPAIAKSAQSTQKIFVQTSSGLEMAGKEYTPDSFDKEVPGTIELTSTPSAPGGGTSWLKSYDNVIARFEKTGGTPLDDGRFSFTIPYQMGAVEEVLLSDDDKSKPTLKVKAGDTVIVGVPYTTKEGEERWITRTITFTGDTFMEVMDRRHQEILSDRYVGEKMYIRLLAPMLNTTDEKDSSKVTVKASSGQTLELELSETFSHSGQFKGLVTISHVDEMPENEAERDPGTLYVKYGDKVSFLYENEGVKLEREVDINKGFDGAVTAFTKRFKDDDIAIRTQFALVEAYFELAKKHRELAKAAKAKGDEKGERDLSSLARREIQIGRKLLEEAMRDFPDNEFKAEAEFLLGNLDMELGDETDEKENPERKKQLYNSAINRFTDIVGKYPSHTVAAEAQYKKALAYERLSKFEPSYSSNALEEFVKLSYRYPKSERVADTIVRLGNYFRKEGEALTKKAEEMDKANNKVEAARLRQQSTRLYRTAAEVFSRLYERYPEHKLALTTKVLSGYYYTAAAQYDEALETLYDVMGKEAASTQNKADAMYWAAYCYMQMDKSGKFKEPYKSPTGQLNPVLEHAYIMLKKLTWDYPDTNRARQARTIMTQGEFEGFAGG